MALLIKFRKSSELEVKKISRGDLQTILVVLSWKKAGIWGKVKNFVYRNELMKKKGSKKSIGKSRKTFWEKFWKIK